MFAKLFKSKYWNNVATVMVGTVLAQALPLLILPLLARFLDTSELGAYFAWYARSLILAVVVGLAFESAIFTVDTEKDIQQIIRAVFFSASVILMSIWIIWTSLFPIIGFTEVLGLNSFGFYTIGIFAGAFAVQNCLIASLVYRGDFKAQAKAKFLAAGLVAIFQCCSVLFGFGFEGLIIAQISAIIISSGTILYFSKIQIFTQTIVEFYNNSLSTIVNFRKFPMLAMPGLLIGTLSAQLPVIFISEKFGLEKVAFFSMALKAIAVPIGLIGSSMLQVFKQAASAEIRSVGNCRKAYSHTFRNLALLSIIPMLFVLYFSELIFKVLFGAEYLESAHIAKLLLPSILFGFVASPLGYTLLITGKQHWDLLWKIGLLLLIVTVFSINLSFDMSITTYSIGYAALYIVYAYMSWRASKIRSRL